MREFIRKEISEASNIKNKANRKGVASALRKILNAFVEFGHNIGGKAYFSDGDELVVVEYEGIRKRYHCGKDYLKIEKPQKPTTVLIVVDASEACIGEIQGERINVLWHEDSMVPKKHHKGGQSAQRFARGREQALKRWLRDVAEKLRLVYDGREIIIGGPGMTKDRFVEELHTDVRNAVKDVRSCGYTDENGLWEMMRLSRTSP